jgi:GAF domain-containing protein
MHTGEKVSMTLEQVRRRWLPLAVIADQVGVRSFLAVPLQVGGRAIGVLNLYGTDTAVPEPDADLLTVLTE